MSAGSESTDESHSRGHDLLYLSWPEHVPIPELFICPLTKRLMRHPVIDREGNSYEKDAILRNLRRRREGEGFSPVTGNPLHESDLVDNKGLHMAIEAALQKALEDERRSVHKSAATGQPARRSKARQSLRGISKLSSSMKVAMNKVSSIAREEAPFRRSEQNTSSTAPAVRNGGPVVFRSERAALVGSLGGLSNGKEFAEIDYSLRTLSSAGSAGEDDDASSSNDQIKHPEKRASEENAGRLPGERAPEEEAGTVEQHTHTPDYSRRRRTAQRGRRTEYGSINTGDSALDAGIAAFLQAGTLRTSYMSAIRHDGGQGMTTHEPTPGAQSSGPGGKVSEGALDRFEERLRKKLAAEDSTARSKFEPTASSTKTSTIPRVSSAPVVKRRDSKLDDYEERMRRKISTDLTVGSRQQSVVSRATTRSDKDLQEFEDRVRRKLSSSVEKDVNAFERKQSHNPTESSRRSSDDLDRRSSADLVERKVSTEDAPKDKPNFCRAQDERRRPERQQMLEYRLESRKSMGSDKSPEQAKACAPSARHPTRDRRKMLADKLASIRTLEQTKVSGKNIPGDDEMKSSEKSRPRDSLLQFKEFSSSRRLSDLTQESIPEESEHALEDDSSHHSVPVTEGEKVLQRRRSSLLLSESSSRNLPEPDQAGFNDSVVSWTDLDGEIARAQFMSLRVTNNDALQLQSELQSCMQAGGGGDGDPFSPKGQTVGPAGSQRRHRGRGEHREEGVGTSAPDSLYADDVNALMEALKGTNTTRVDALAALRGSNGNRDKALGELLGFGQSQSYVLSSGDEGDDVGTSIHTVDALMEALQGTNLTKDDARAALREANGNKDKALGKLLGFSQSFFDT